MFTKNRIVMMFILILIFLLLNIGFLFSDEKTMNLQSVVLEDFELNENGKPKKMWMAIPNRFGREGSLESGKSLQEVSWIESWPESYFGKNGEFDDGNGLKKYKTCLAVKLAFERQGYNSVELFPLEEKEGKYKTTNLPFRGRVRQLDMWVWGANYQYEMEIVIMDYRGVEWRLPVGSIHHIGWKNFTVYIPNYIPQSVSYIPSTKRFSLVKVVIWTTPREKVSGAYLYIDHIKYLTDIFESNYDGYNLGQDDTIKNLWDKGPKAPDETQLIQ